jgi:hypothetical protein
MGIAGALAASDDGRLDALAAVTDEEPKPSWRLRKTRYIADLRTATPSAALVSAADKLAHTGTRAGCRT